MSSTHSLFARNGMIPMFSVVTVTLLHKETVTEVMLALILDKIEILA